TIILRLVFSHGRDKQQCVTTTTKPPGSVMDSASWAYPGWVTGLRANVRFGSKADMCSANRYVRFTPNSDRESGFSQRIMSALPPNADMCGAHTHVCFGPKADSRIAAKKIPIR